MAELPVNFRHFVVSVIQKYTNFQTSQAYIFRILQHFATKRGNFTNFNMLFLAVVKDFDFFAKMQIQFKRGMVHCLEVQFFPENPFKISCKCLFGLQHRLNTFKSLSNFEIAQRKNKNRQDLPGHSS